MHLFRITSDCALRAGFQTRTAAGTCRFIDCVVDQTLTDASRTPFLLDVCDVLVFEVRNRCQNRVCRRCSETAERCIGQQFTEVFQEFDVAFSSSALAYPAENLAHPLKPFPAWHTLAARLAFKEIDEVTRHIDHAGILIHHDHAAGTHHRAVFGEALVVHRQIEQAFRYTAP